MRKTQGLLAFVGAALVLGSMNLHAASGPDARRFIYSVDADSVSQKGKFDYQFELNQKNARSAGVYSKWDVEHAIQYGVTDKFTLGLEALMSSTYSSGTPGVTDTNAIRFDGIALEGKYMFSDPSKGLGSLVYLETIYSGSAFGFEEKLALQTNFSKKVTGLLNFQLAQNWALASTGNTLTSTLAATGGLAYAVDSNWSLGLELRQLWAYNDFFGAVQYTAFYAGPNVHYENKKWWATLAILPQLTTNYTNAEKLEVRLMAGVQL